jgi:hypothetical protein
MSWNSIDSMKYKYFNIAINHWLLIETAMSWNSIDSMKYKYFNIAVTVLYK